MRFTIAFVCLFAVGCTNPGNGGDREITKEDATRLAATNQDEDFCQDAGWYGDGICDDFCVDPDPDCSESSGSCGGLRGEGCDPDAYCDYTDGCGAADQGGVCRTRPEVCTQVWAPVCGCDGRTYASDCVAAAAGVDVASEGECEGNQDEGQDEDEYGEDEDEDEDEGGDGGWNGDRDCPRDWAPVCSCAGQTFRNACYAEKAGASVDYSGECGDEDSFTVEVDRT